MNMIDINLQKRISVEILSYFHEVCTSMGLTYYLAYGTLLGAIRHKGYIPWDDDIDIMMPRNDYENLIKNFPKNENYEIVDNSVNKDYGRSFAVINDKRTRKNEFLLRNKCNRMMCVNIDVFPLDSLPDNKEEQFRLLKNVRSIENKLACITYRYGKGRNILSTIRKNFGIFYYRILEFLNVYSIQSMVSKHNKYMNLYSDSNTNTIGCLANTGHNGIKEFLKKEFFDRTILVEFEGKKYYAPVGYDKILSQIYGDYMKLPPKENQKSNHTSESYFV